MTRLSNWKEESDLFEVVTGKMTDEKALKKVDEKKGIKNKITINPKLTEAIKELGGELIEANEEEGKVDTADEAKKKSEEQKKKQIENKQKRAQMIKKQVLMKKLIAVRQGSEDIVAHHEPEGEALDERLGGKGYQPYTSLTGKKISGDWEDSDRGAGNKAKVAAERKKRQDADNKAYAARAKKAGFKSTQDYTNVIARYGSEDNYKKGRGLGT